MSSTPVCTAAALAAASLLATACATTASAATESDGRPLVLRRQCEVDGARLRYLDAGTGDEALVLVHGWASDHRAWTGQVPELAGRARTLAVDLPGHGGSEPPPAGYSMAAFADAVAAAMDDAGVERAVLVGHSNGTPVVREVYRRFPDRVIALVLVDGALRNFVADEALQSAYLEQFAGDEHLAAARGFVDGMLPPDFDPALADAIREMALDQPQHAMVGGLEASFEPAIWAPDPIEVPVLAIMTDAEFWDDEYRAFASSIAPELEWRTMEDATHFLMWERPAEFNAILVAYLDERGLLR